METPFLGVGGGTGMRHPSDCRIPSGSGDCSADPELLVPGDPLLLQAKDSSTDESFSAFGITDLSPVSSQSLILYYTDGKTVQIL